MDKQGPPGLSATSKRLLGIRDFDPATQDEKKALLKSEDRLKALEAIDTSTMPRGAKREMKRGIVLETLRRQLLSEEILRNNPLVYLGSGTDIEYPLALGARRIILVDTIFQNPEAVKDVVRRIEGIISANVSGDAARMSFEFDFGNGKESAVLEISSKPYISDSSPDGFIIPDATGALVLYASQGPSGMITVDEQMKSKLVEGGAILEDADITKRKAGGQFEQIRLGRMFE